VEHKQSEIETLDSRRMRYLELYLIGVGIFLVLSVTRYFFRLGNLNARPIGIAVLVGLILSLGLIGFSTIQTAAFRRKIKGDRIFRRYRGHSFLCGRVVLISSQRSGACGADLDHRWRRRLPCDVLCSVSIIMTEKKLDNKMKIFRAMNDWTQEELALRVGVTRKTINTVENGRFVPSALLALKIAKVFGVPVEEVFQLPDDVV
jgi:putative transcriptional regulator